MKNRLQDSTLRDYQSRVKSDMAAARSYSHRKESKHRAEMALIEKGLVSATGIGTALDAPCGVGRAAIFMAQKGINTTGVDLGKAAVEVAIEKAKDAGVNVDFNVGDIENLIFDNMAFDAVLCFRLYHHFPDDSARDPIVASLCRVARRYVLISYLSPYAYTSIKRRLRKSLGGKPSKQYTTRPGELASKFSKHGFKLIRDIPQARFRHTLHLAIFERV